jgi:hypothetical protein
LTLYRSRSILPRTSPTLAASWQEVRPPAERVRPPAATLKL